MGIEEVKDDTILVDDIYVGNWDFDWDVHRQPWTSALSAIVSAIPAALV